MQTLLVAFGSRYRGHSEESVAVMVTLREK